jgi:hypothetical protein
MTNVGDPPQYFWCIRHNRVEHGDGKCASKYLLGPYPSPADAEQALAKVKERNEEWEEEDARWSGDPS